MTPYRMSSVGRFVICRLLCLACSCHALLNSVRVPILDACELLVNTHPRWIQGMSFRNVQAAAICSTELERRVRVCIPEYIALDAGRDLRLIPVWVPTRTAYGWVPPTSPSEAYEALISLGFSPWVHNLTSLEQDYERRAELIRDLQRHDH